MDDDPVLRALGEDLARDDPRLAALLGAGPRAVGHHHGPPGAGSLLLLVAAAAVCVAAPLVVGLPALGVIGVLLVLAAPVVVLRWATRPPDGTS